MTELTEVQLATWRQKFQSAPRPRLREWLGENETPAEFLTKLANTLAWQWLPLAEFRQYTPRLDLIPFADAKRRLVMAVETPTGKIGLLCANPFADMHLRWADQRLNGCVSRWLIDAEDLTAYLALVEDQLLATDTMALATEPLEGSGQEEGLTLASIAEDSSPVVKLVNSTIYDAWRAGVSDIHLESTAQGLRVRYRLDGVLTEVTHQAGTEQAEQAISRIKVLAELDIAEKRIPQDGRFKLLIRGQTVDFRVSIMPSIFGEDAVLRLLDKQGLVSRLEKLTLASLGYDEPVCSQVLRLAREPYGMLLVTGPTGSGKTTSLYAIVETLDSLQDKIVTIEDPVEYQLPNALQIPVNEKKGLTFARGLRSILRHDPDTILVGEIRDAETAQIAVQSALTGHLVLTSVHANNAFDVIGRLLHMGLDPYSFVSALNGIMAQRLIRMNCPHCSKPYQPSDALLHESGLQDNDRSAYRFTQGQGCAECRGTGFKGRQAVVELLLLNDDLRERILAREAISKIRQAARAQGMLSLRDHALAKVRQGLTTLEEINRVTFVESISV